jgi:hypothetical protein
MFDWTHAVQQSELRFGNVVNAGEQCGRRRKTEGRCVFRGSAHCVGSRASLP